MQDRVLAVVFDSSSYGRVVVKEHLPDVPEDQYQASNEYIASLTGQPTFPGAQRSTRFAVASGRW
ncbi:MAG: hypothetical protein LC808_02725 [Actinobacteria bacterium]|nr:hypothetical protein [Actinomycetota bacterium]